MGSGDTPDLTQKLENYYDFQCDGGPLRNCVEWQALKAELIALRAALAEAQAERDTLRAKVYGGGKEMTDDESAAKLDDIRVSGAIRPVCSAIVFDSRAVNWPCSRNGQVEREGKWFCRQHDPIAREKRAAESLVRFHEKYTEADAADDTLIVKLQAAEARADALQAERDKLTRERDELKVSQQEYMLALLRAGAAEIARGIEEARADAAERTINSLATMLGWENVPPQSTLEAEMRALKARAVRTDAAEGALREARERMGTIIACAEQDSIVNPQFAGGLGPVIEMLAELASAPVAYAPIVVSVLDNSVSTTCEGGGARPVAPVAPTEGT